MTLQKSYKDLKIFLCDDILYDLNSVDNSKSYAHIYSDKNYDDFLYLTRHGIEIYREDDLINSSLIISGGGTSGIHETSSIIDNDRLLICCAHSVFCMTLPDLNLDWRTTVDSATCFEIFKFKDNFIIHGELEISKLDTRGNIIWRFSGNDIFTTPTGRDAFRIVNEIIYATNWDNVTFELNANTGQLINQETIKSKYY